MEKRFVEDENGRVWYWITDNAKDDTIFFMHGLTANHTMFEKQIEYFKDKYNVIAWDAPLHGESRLYAHFSFENASKAIKQILDDNGITKAIFAGQSLGGYFTQSFYIRYPEMVKAFISIDSTPYGDYYSKSDIFWIKQVEWMAKLFPGKTLIDSMAKVNALTKEGQDNMRSMVSVYEKNELCRLMQIGYAGFLEDNREINMTCPILMLVGTKDKTGKVRAYNEAWSKKLNQDIVWIPDAAHNSNVDNPTAVNEAITRFIKGLSD